MKRFFPVATMTLVIVGLGVQPSSSMFLFPDASAEYKSYATQPVDIMFLTPDEAYGMPLRTLKEQKIHSPSGKLMLILSPNEHVLFQDGKLVRYFYMVTGNDNHRVELSPVEAMPLITNLPPGILYDAEFFATKPLQERFIDKIDGLPADFAGAFVLEESYYTTEGKTHASPHLFLFTEEGEAVKLTSYQLPKAADGGAATYETLPPLKWEDLEISEKFTPALYTLHDGVWEGGSVSMFSPVLKFTLYERFSQESLEVAETMEVNGKRTFGYDVPIVYRRAAD